MLTLLASAGLAAQQPARPDPSLPARAAATPMPPEDFLGYPVGADFKLAGYDSITAYLNHLADVSPAVRVDTLGSTTLGRPFVLVTVTSPQNFARLDQIQAAQAKLADPRKLSDEELPAILETQPVVVFIAHNLHSTEIASSQASMELVHALVTDRELVELLDDVVVLLVPSANPDGQVMVVDWYRRIIGTP